MKTLGTWTGNRDIEIVGWTLCPAGLQIDQQRRMGNHWV